MENNEKHYSLGVTNQDQRDLLLSLTQPMTATQLSRKLSLPLVRCSNALLGLKKQKLVRCLNPEANRNHLFWLTPEGTLHQRELAGGDSISHDVPDIDWELYASVCYSQRSVVIKMLTYAMQPGTIKRRATFRVPGLTMNSNNVRDVVYYLRKNSIVRPVPLKKKVHPGYELTELGLHMRRLLLQAEVRQ